MRDGPGIPGNHLTEALLASSAPHEGTGPGPCCWEIPLGLPSPKSRPDRRGLGRASPYTGTAAFLLQEDTAQQFYLHNSRGSVYTPTIGLLDPSEASTPVNFSRDLDAALRCLRW